ncbi:MAG: ABC transporter permease subunit [Clostridia bacterium]
MMKERLKNILNKLYPLLAVALFLVIWLVAAKAINIEMILPTPHETLRRLFILMGGGDFWVAVLGTLRRSLLSFFYSFMLALVLAVISYAVKPVYKLLSPIVTIARAVPTMSIILLAIIWLTSESSPMLIAGLIVFPLLYANFYAALSGMDRELINMSKLYKVPFPVRLFKLYIPSILPAMFAGIKSSISLNLKVTIASEVLAQTRDSMGRFMQISRVYLDTAELLAWTVAAIIFSYLLEISIELIKKAVVRWR